MLHVWVWVYFFLLTGCEQVAGFVASPFPAERSISAFTPLSSRSSQTRLRSSDPNSDKENEEQQEQQLRSRSFLDRSLDRNKEKEEQKGKPRDLIARFFNPIIDDPGLPFADTLVAQIVAPSLQVFWIGLIHAPSPIWLRPIFDSQLWQARGSLVAPTLIHGAGLACCWIAGALAAQAYERKAIDPTVEGYGTVVWSIMKAGAFAVGLLIFSTQVDLLFEFGRFVLPGESEATDLRLLSAIVEILNDVAFEASVITSMRLYLAFVTARGASR
jgi:hypothetical protein